MTDFCQHVPMSRLFETQNSRGFIDPTLRSLCGVIEIQPLRGCKKSVFYQTRAYFFCWVVFSFFLALHHPFQYLSQFVRDKPIPPIVPYLKKLPIGSEAPVELWTFDSAAENNNTAATIPSPSLRPRDAIAPPFVPCLGIPYHLLRPVPGRLRPPHKARCPAPMASACIETPSPSH